MLKKFGMSNNNQVQQVVDKMKSKMTDSEWESFVDIARQQLGEDSPLDQFEWVLRNALRKQKKFELNKAYDLKSHGKGFKSGNIQLIRDTRDSKIFVSSFHVNRPDGTNKLANITLYRFERKRNETSEKLEWEFDCKMIIDNPSSRDYPVTKLFAYVKKQLSLDGHKLDSGFAKIIESKSKNDLLLQTDILEKVNNLEDSEKLNEIIDAVSQNESVVISEENYRKLIESRFKSKTITDYEKDLAEFRSLLSGEKSSETDMQDFLDKRVWFFGLNYFQSHRNSKPKFTSTLGSQYDFLLEKFNQVYDIVELKGPNDQLFEVEKEGERKRSFDNRIDYKFSSQFSRALHQVMSYMDEFEENFDHIKSNQPSIKDFMYPKGTIVLSKRELFPKDGKNSIKYLHLINRQFGNIDILTYDDLADRAENIIQFMKKIQENTSKQDF